MTFSRSSIDNVTVPVNCLLEDGSPLWSFAFCGLTMGQILGCLTQQHDWRLLVLACTVCCLAGIASIHVFRRAHSGPRVQVFWLATAGLVAASGIWATHFIAMLAYRPGVDVAYGIPLTILSLLATAGITTAAFWV